MAQTLNEDFVFARDASPKVRSAFEGDSILTVELPAATRLWKWADFLPEPGRSVSPWWLPLEPRLLAIGDRFRVLQSLEERARQRGGGPRSVFRSGVAVLQAWSRLSQMVIVSLRQDTLAFAGPAAMQQETDPAGEPTPIYLAGGYWQLYVPNLSGESIEICDSRTELLKVGADPEFWLSPFPPDTSTVALSPKARRLLRLFGLPED